MKKARWEVEKNEVVVGERKKEKNKLKALRGSKLIAVRVRTSLLQLRIVLVTMMSICIVLLQKRNGMELTALCLAN